MDDGVSIVGVVGGRGCRNAWGVGIEQGHGAWVCGREQGRVVGRRVSKGVWWVEAWACGQGHQR